MRERKTGTMKDEKGALVADFDARTKTVSTIYNSTVCSPKNGDM